MTKNKEVQDQEVWKTVKDYFNYEVSNIGNIRRTDTTDPVPRAIHDNGSVRITLKLPQKKYKNVFLHSLIVQAFYNLEDRFTVKHKNGNKKDNRLVNLNIQVLKGESKRSRYLVSKKPIKGERWRKIKRYPNYKVSNHGRIKRLDKNVIMDFTLNERGFFTVFLKGDESSEQAHVHIEVARTFLNLNQDTSKVVHANSDKTDNRVENLRIKTSNKHLKNKRFYGDINTILREKKVKFLRGEKWKVIMDFHYVAVSNMGRVVNMDSGVLLPQAKVRDKHLGVTITEGRSKQKTYSIHQLVATHFIESFDPKQHRVLHIDGDTTNNKLKNLHMESRMDKSKVDKKIKTLEEQSLKGEKWKVVADFPNYKVSTMGRVGIIDKGQIRYRDHGDSYVRMTLHNNGISKEFSVHRLVALTFIPNPQNKKFVNHKNGIKHDNRLVNLEWSTPKENSQHAVETGLNDSSKRMDPRAINVDQYTADWKFVKRWNSVRQAADKLKINRDNIYRSCLNFNRRANGYYFKYVFDDRHNDKEKEEWKPIADPKYKHYFISNLGRIKSENNYVLQFHLTKEGYYQIGLKAYHKDKPMRKQKNTLRVNRLVALTFIPNPQSLPYVNHINGVKSDNRVENLEWVDEKGNAQHAIRTGLTKFKSKKVLQTRIDGKIIKEWNSIRDASEELGIAKETIRSVCVGKNSTGGGYKWQYVD